MEAEHEAGDLRPMGRIVIDRGGRPHRGEAEEDEVGEPVDQEGQDKDLHDPGEPVFLGHIEYERENDQDHEQPLGPFEAREEDEDAVFPQTEVPAAFPDRLPQQDAGHERGPERPFGFLDLPCPLEEEEDGGEAEDHVDQAHDVGIVRLVGPERDVEEVRIGVVGDDEDEEEDDEGEDPDLDQKRDDALAEPEFQRFFALRLAKGGFLGGEDGFRLFHDVLPSSSRRSSRRRRGGWSR